MDKFVTHLSDLELAEFLVTLEKEQNIELTKAMSADTIEGGDMHIAAYALLTNYIRTCEDESKRRKILRYKAHRDDLAKGV